MTFKYTYTFPINGNDKVQRFKEWAQAHVPGLAFSLPPQSPIKTVTMTVLLQSMEDRRMLMEKLAGVRF